MKGSSADFSQEAFKLALLYIYTHTHIYIRIYICITLNTWMMLENTAVRFQYSSKLERIERMDRGGERESNGGGILRRHTVVLSLPFN